MPVKKIITRYTFYLRLIFILIIFPSIKLYSQYIHFRHLSINDGLSQNAVFSILQDREGFMWFGTKDGLNRYDGYSFTVFQNDPFDSTTVSSNYITTLFEDSRGVLWIGTLNGDLNCYQKENETFIHINYQSDTSGNLYNSKISSIAEDPRGNLWIGTAGNGLFKLSLTRENFSQIKSKHFAYNPDDKNSVSSNNISALFVDSFGILWIGTDNNLEEYNYSKENFEHYIVTTKSPEASSFQGDNEIGAIYENKNAKFWLGTPSGLVLFNRSDGNYKLFPHHYNKFRFGWGRITGIIEDNSGKLWLSTPGELMKFDTDKKLYNYYRNDPFEPSSISYNSISSLYCDSTGILWFGTSGKGINIYDPKKSRFSTLVRSKDEKSRIAGFSIRSILEDNEGIVWISTDVLYRWDRKSGELKSYETTSNRPDDFGNTGIWSMVQSANGNIWFATSRGLYKYNPQTKTSRLFKYNQADSSGLPQREVFFVFEDQNKNIWIATENYLSEVIDIDRGRFKNFRYNNSNSKSEAVRPSIYEDAKGIFWIGTNKGLLSFNNKTGKFFSYLNNPSDLKSIDNNYIKSICPDPSEPDKFLWIGTNGGGINKFNLGDKTFSYYTKRNGLPNNVVYGILPDEKGNLWLSTNKGLSKFNPVSGEFKNYDALDGLQSNEFNTGAYFRSKKGEMFFGGINGLNYFMPNNIKENHNIPKIAITKCKILNQTSSETGNHESVSKTTFNKDTLILPYDKNIIQFEFAALDYSASEKNQYTYKLENFNNNWIESGKIHFATYTNLSPGKYIFRVRGSNNDGIWNNEGASLVLIILPPWWLNWWAYSLYILIFFSGLYFLRRYELNRLRLKNQLKLEKVSSDTLRQLDKMKSHFFANISHEFRTPLTLILGQIDNVISSKIDVSEKGKLHVAHRNARRLLTLINQLLDLSKLEAGSMKLHTEQHNIVSFLKSLFYSFESLAESHKITLKFESELESIPVIFDPDKMEKVFYNLISNAFKFTSKGGEIIVLLKILNSSLVEIRVKDTGKGIHEDQLEYIFNRFYQVNTSSLSEFEGSGIGLALTKELIELHKGNITVKSKLDEGTEFIIHLPLGDLKKLKENSAPSKYDLFSPENYLNNVVFDETESENNNEEFQSSNYKNDSEECEVILIVEDNADVRHYIREQIETDYKLIEASNGEEGIAKAKENIPDLIITDVMMPKINGYQFCREKSGVMKKQATYLLLC